jgi:hypothetical protein
MTAREIYEGVLVELNKENSQSFTIEEFNYIINKAILAMCNEKYNFYAVNGQLGDDLRVLLKKQSFSISDSMPIDGTSNTDNTFNSTSAYVTADVSNLAVIPVSNVRDFPGNVNIRFEGDPTNMSIASIDKTLLTITLSSPVSVARGTNIYIDTPETQITTDAYVSARTVDLTFMASDYFHLDSCRTVWRTRKPSDNSLVHLTFAAKRLTNDMSDAILYNTYLAPAATRPYHQILDNSINSGVLQFDSTAYTAPQNKPKFRIHVGAKNNALEFRTVDFEYLKLPEIVVLRDSDIFTAGADPSQLIEFPDYLRNEIIRRCTAYLLEKESDPRLQTHPLFNQEMPSVPMNVQLGGGQQRQQQRYQQQDDQSQ